MIEGSQTDAGRFIKGQSAAARAPQPPGTSTLDLALRIIEFLAHQSGPCSLGSIASALSASKPTIYRHLQTLLRHDFVRRDPVSGRYEAGVKLMVLGEASKSRFEILKIARPELQVLRTLTGQAVTICTLIRDEVIVLELIEGRTGYDFSTRPGTSLALHASAHGKIWLAFGPAGLLEQVITETMVRLTPRTLVSPSALRSAINEIRRRGWASAPDEVINGVNTIASPVFDHTGALRASVGIVGATQFIPAEPNSLQFEAVFGTARTISRSIGYKGVWS